jgi:hypothetical protein
LSGISKNRLCMASSPSARARPAKTGLSAARAAATEPARDTVDYGYGAS